MMTRSWLLGCAVGVTVAQISFAAESATSQPKLTLDTMPAAVPAEDGLLMQGLDKIGAKKALDDLNLKIYGWIEVGYTYNLRHRGGEGTSGGYYGVGPFNREKGNHLTFNQMVLRFEREVNSSKWDIGGRVELLEGTDTYALRTNGMEIQTPGDNPGEVPQFDVTQAYVDFNIPLGNGIKVRVGKYESLMGYERVDPRANAFYTHSMLFGDIDVGPQTGVEIFYQMNDQLKVAGGITRGQWQSTEDNNSAVTGNLQAIYAPTKDWEFTVNFETGPEVARDESYYQTTVNPIAIWKATDRLSLAFEGVYNYQGIPSYLKSYYGLAHGSDETWGLAGYVSYKINDYLTANGRVEWAHSDEYGLANSIYALSAGVALRPMPKDPIGKNLLIRPELRYLYSEEPGYPVGHTPDLFRDQWVLAADVVFTF